jgi:S1-C subfamily serine protease
MLIICGFIPTSDGLLIHEVPPNDLVDKAGLRQWDVIKTINGTPIYAPQHFSEYTKKVTLSTIIILKVLNYNREVTRCIETKES